jgi:hypothetical protein
MKTAVIGIMLTGMLAVGSITFAQETKPASCPEDLEVLKLVYATSRSNAELYLETLARGDVKLRAVQAQLDAANKKIKELEDARLAEGSK